MDDRTQGLRLIRHKALMRELQKEWSKLADKSTYPQTKKWYRYFSAELESALNRAEFTLANIDWVESGQE